ncbi:MAG: hypothetical protein ACM3PT_07130 [Deltaproteobacteria bacterium]
MKKINFLYVVVFAFILTSTFYSCTKDEVPPTVSLLSGSGFQTSDASLPFESDFKVQVKGVKGDVNMKTLTIYENGTKLPLERIVDGLNANPALLTGADAESFTKAITLKAQKSGISDYLFVVEDENALKDTVDIRITGFTPFNINVTDLKLWNFHGPNFGSIDLQKGVALSSDDTNGDAQDVGIVNVLTDQTWKKKIKTKNGTLMATPAANLNFDDVTDLDKLIAAFNAGTQVQEAGVTVNSVFLFKTPKSITGKTSDDYFIMKTKELKETTGDNLDYYIFHLKGKAY